MEKNMAFNAPLKENLANAAINILAQNQLITEEDFKTLSFEMGYMLQMENEQLEALFKICYSGKKQYFALQNNKLMILKYTDELFNQTVEYMKANHPCLLSDELPETGVQKNRREKNNNILRAQNIVVPERLMTRWDDEKIILKDKESICKRAIACFFVIQIACDIGNGKYEEGLNALKPYLEQYGVMDQLNSKEKKILDGTYTMQDAIDMDLAYQADWSLVGSLGLIDDISDASQVCDCQKAIELVTSCKTTEEFIAKCNLRSKEEILDMLDLFFRYHWALNESKAKQGVPVGNLNPSVVLERRRGLEWIVTNVEDWYDLPMPA